MGFDQYHEPASELSAETRTFARMIASLTEEAEAIGWYAQRISVEPDEQARAIMENAQQEEFKHFAMDLEFLTRRSPKWRVALEKTLFVEGDIVEAGERAEKAEGPQGSTASRPRAATRVLSPYKSQVTSEGTPMPDTTCHMSISLDGFVAGPDQSREAPLGKRGRELHGWHLGDERANDGDATAADWLMRPRGAYVMGRNMFGPVRGEWDEDWRGWWGPEPPYHAPVFVLTHHARKPIEMDGGTTFHFVTGGFDAAYAQARETAGDEGVDIAGGASTVRQALLAGVVDELTLDIAPVLVGSGERIFDGVEYLGMEPVEVLHSPLATHIRYRRGGWT